MKVCTMCSSKIKYSSRLKSIFSYKGDIVCNNCKSVYRLKKNKFRNIYTFIASIIGGSMAVFIPGYKGLVLGTIFMIVIFMIEVSISKEYILINKS